MLQKSITDQTFQGHVEPRSCSPSTGNEGASVKNEEALVRGLLKEAKAREEGKVTIFICSEALSNVAFVATQSQ